jgi:hypothetical protein
MGVIGLSVTSKPVESSGGEQCAPPVSTPTFQELFESG